MAPAHGGANGLSGDAEHLLPIGQAIGLAAGYRQRHGSVAKLLQALRRASQQQIESAAGQGFLDEGGEPTALYRAATRRIALGFYEDPGDAKLQRWNAEHEQQMRAVIRGFTDEDTTLAGLPSAQGPHPVATIFGFPNTVEVGAGAVPAWMITGVGVAPTHRRRGILRRMMEPELARARSEGCGMAALTVSEGEIYGRFGFGLSTRMITYELDLTARPRLLPGVVERSGARQGRIHQAQGKELVEFGLALRERAVSDSTLQGDANLLVCPSLDAANILFNVLKTTDGHGITIGPILLGSAFPAHVMTPSATVRRLVNMTALAVAEVAAGKKHKAGGVA